jgi:glycosyltransferase involved in cell wall biosynthesis
MTREDGRYGDAPGSEGLVASIIIPHYNDLENLKVCLELLAAQTAPTRSFEIIVADNNSACGFEAVASVCEGVARVVRAPDQGAGLARNVGVNCSSGQFLAFLDSDCRPDSDWICNGVRAIRSADMVGGNVIVSVQDAENPTPTESFELVFAFNNKRYVETKGFSVTANMFVRRAVFDAVGGFFSGVSEDMEWGHRATALGFRWRYDPSVVVRHPARRDWPELQRKWKRLVRESFAYSKKRRFGLISWLARSWLIAISPIRDAPAIFCSKRLKRFKTRVSAAGVLCRLRWWRFIEGHKVLFE